ncbi:hypothetical protein E2C01_049113 [Portunus trituberculatus]|uniref:Uncharacterized protein n=1 Tax=Portunus trituberculatus TaxID=210409 RepID=A0A5B7G8C2_PORTR|nr:hypothetical protein [Portunus trituberculatus]
MEDGKLVAASKSSFVQTSDSKEGRKLSSLLIFTLPPPNTSSQHAMQIIVPKTIPLIMPDDHQQRI